MKKKSVSSLKKKAWGVFSAYIKRKYGREDYKEAGAVCYTCGERVKGSNLHAGHWISGRHNAILFEEDGVRPQCRLCNFFYYGKGHIFGRHLEMEIGRDRTDRLIALAKTSKQWTVAELESIIKKYEA